VIEREAKLDADPALVLPELDGAVPGAVVEVAPSKHLDALYYDGTSLPLARVGATVRYRTGEGGGKWTVKRPGQADGSLLARDEIDVHAPPSPVPDAVCAQVAALLGGEVLAPVARLVTDRSRLVVRDESGGELAEVADDVVQVLDGEREVAVFREVEVELTPGAPVDVLHAIVHRLEAAGASATDPTPKLVRAVRLMGSV
jgi:inorganic triphosphatase YgiF